MELRTDEINALRRALMHAMEYSDRILDENILDRDELAEFKEFKHEYRSLLQKLSRSYYDLQTDYDGGYEVRYTGVSSVGSCSSGI